MNPRDGDWSRELDLVARIGIAVNQTRPAASAWRPQPESDEDIPSEGERPS